MKKILSALLAVVLCLGLVRISAFSKSPNIQKKDAEESKSPKSSKTAWLGVMTQTVNDDIADAFDIDIDHGAIINEVIKDSPAEKADLDEGDVIISFNGQKVWDQDDLTDFVENSEIGSQAALVVIRDGKEMTINVELGERSRRNNVVFRNGKNPGATWFNGPDDMQVFNWSGGYIGIQLSDLTEQLAKYFGVPGDEGVLITEVNDDSPAQEAGLMAGDVITGINGENISSYGEIKEIVSESDEGDRLNVTVVRNKKERTIEVTVAEADENDNEFGYQFFQAPPVPNIPDIDVRVPRAPRAPGRFNRGDDRPGAYFDFDSYKNEMDAFKAEMEKYKLEMKALNKEAKRSKVNEVSELEREIEELRAKIAELEKKIK